MAKNTSGLTPFKKGQTGNPKGRTPDALNAAMKKITKEELEDIANIIIKGDVAQLQSIRNDHKSPAIRAMFAAVVLKIISKGDMEAFDKLLNRMIGKVKETLDVTGNGVAPTTIFLNIPDNGRAAKNDE